MASKKVTITLDESLVEALAGAAEEEGIPLSRLVAGAAERELRLRAGRAVIREWQDEQGGFTPDELAAARADMAAADAGRPVRVRRCGVIRGCATSKPVVSGPAVTDRDRRAGGCGTASGPPTDS